MERAATRANGPAAGSGNGEAAGWLSGAARRARAAARVLARSDARTRNDALAAAAVVLRDAAGEILAANALDVANSTAGAAFRDRLILTPDRIEAMARGMEQVADLPDPLNRVLAEWEQPNGLRFRRIAVPVGVIGMIYESRPNVGADAAALCLKSGNAVLLRGGSDSLRSAGAIHRAVVRGLERAGLPADCVQVPPDADRAHVAAMLAASGRIDLVIPRGGRSLVERVQRDARVPVLAHAEGLCHTYVHRSAEPGMARRLVANAKMRRTGICGATETLLIDAEVAPDLLPLIAADLRALGCALHGDAASCALVPGIEPAGADDFDTEWLDAVLSVAVVDGVDAALAHIARHGSAHTEAIIASDEAAARRFLDGSDSAVTVWNASTQFCDGGEFGFGAEIGIATGRVHARGPVGLEQLTCFRYEVIGTGQIRP